MGGYVTAHFAAQGYPTTTLSGLDARTATQESLQAALMGPGRPQVLINCIGVIPQRGPEAQADLAAVNAHFPHTLAAAAAAASVPLIHLSTDCVFAGTRGKYRESDTPDSTEPYGLSKAAGEPAGACIVRTSFVGSERKGKKSLLEWLKSRAGAVAPGYTNHVWNGVTALQLAKHLESIVRSRGYWVGVRHYHSDTDYSKYDLLRLMAETYGITTTIEPAAGPSYINRTLRSDFAFIPPPPLPQQLREQAQFDEKIGLHLRI